MKTKINNKRNKKQKVQSFHSNHSSITGIPNDHFEPITLKEEGKNLNEYRHLLLNKDPSSCGQTDMKWILNLRNKSNTIDTMKRKPKLKKTISQPPQFYEKDINKLMQKINIEREKKKKKQWESIKENLNIKNIKHLTKSNIDHDQFTFSTTLRTFKPKRNKDNSMPKVKIIEWKDQPYERTATSFHTTRYNVFLPPTKPNDKETLKKIEKYTLRPYETIYDKASIGEKSFKRKKYKKNQLYTLDWYGEHLSLLPYNDNYRGANIVDNETLIKSKNQTNSQLLFSLRLRSFDIKKDEKKDNVIINQRRRQAISSIKIRDSEAFKR